MRSVSAKPSRASSAASAASSPGCGSDRLDLAEPEAQQVGLAGPLPGGLHDLGQLGLGRPQHAVGRGVVVAQLGGLRRRRTGRAPRAARPAWSSRCWSDWPCTATSGSISAGQRADRDRAPPAKARERPSAEICRATHQRAVLDLAAERRPPGRSARRPRGSPSGTRTSPSTRAALAPVRTAPVSARPPSSRPSAVTTIVLPAPVSPVIAVNPGPSSSTDSSITPSERDPDLLKHRSPSVVRRCAGGARRRRASRSRAGRTWRPAGR